MGRSSFPVFMCAEVPSAIIVPQSDERLPNV